MDQGKLAGGKGLERALERPEHGVEDDLEAVEAAVGQKGGEIPPVFPSGADGYMELPPAAGGVVLEVLHVGKQLVEAGVFPDALVVRAIDGVDRDHQMGLEPLKDVLHAI